MEVEKHDVARERPPAALLRRLAKRYGVEQIISTRSPAFRKRDLDVATLSVDDAIRLIDEDPNLLRRPLLVRGDDAVFGWKQDEIATLIR